ncbi:MAG: RNA polymerase sigma factor [Novosphingobium sp.]|nr:RNA polymerase sigma factor [Novosphingobium sp.]
MAQPIDERGGTRADQLALDAIFEEQWPRLMRLLSRRFVRLPSPEDVLQEAFVKFAQLRGQVQDPPAFLTHVAFNLARNALRSEHRRARYESYADLLDGDADLLTPERHALARDEVRQIEAAVAEFPPVCGQVFRMHRFEGMTQTQIARHLGISTTAVEKSMRRAFARLAVAMAVADDAGGSGLGVSSGRCHIREQD